MATIKTFGRFSVGGGIAWRDGRAKLAGLFQALAGARLNIITDDFAHRGGWVRVHAQVIVMGYEPDPSIPSDLHHVPFVVAQADIGSIRWGQRTALKDACREHGIGFEA